MRPEVEMIKDQYILQKRARDKIDQNDPRWNFHNGAAIMCCKIAEMLQPGVTETFAWKRI